MREVSLACGSVVTGRLRTAFTVAHSINGMFFQIAIAQSWAGSQLRFWAVGWNRFSILPDPFGSQDESAVLTEV